MRVAIFIIMFSTPAWGETFDQLVERGGIYYKKNSEASFNGKIEGLEEGFFVNGMKEGLWITYYKTGTPLQEATYKHGVLEGTFKAYQHNGRLRSNGSYKNGRRVGVWTTYKNDGSVWEILSGTYENGIAISD